MIPEAEPGGQIMQVPDREDLFVAYRRLARRSFDALATVLLIGASLIVPPVASAADSPSTNHTVATRTGTVNPRKDGVDRGGGSGATFGVPAAASSSSASLRALRRPGATAPVRNNLPHWLPQRPRATPGASSSIATTLGTRPPTTPAMPSTTRGPGTATAFAAPTTTGLRSDFGNFGLSDADDSLLYPDCSVDQLCEEPPDPGVAVSATSVVQSVNELMLIVDRESQSTRVIPNFDFFSLDNNQVQQSDPRVLYDNSRHRWLATEISSDCGHGYLHMAVSASDDPFGIWTVYRIAFPGRLVDFPGVGTSTDAVIVSLNAYAPDPQSQDCLAPGDYQGAMLVVVDWSDLASRVPSLPVTTTNPEHDLFTWRPATSNGRDGVGRLIVAIDNGTDETSDVGYATISGTNAGRNVVLSPVINLTKDLGLAPFATPPAPRQPGTPATIERAVDGQPTDAISGDGHLWFVATAPCAPNPGDAARDCVRVTDLLVGDRVPLGVAIAADARLQDPAADLFMGGIGRAFDGTMYVVYSRSSPRDQIATWATWQRTGQQSFEPPTLLLPPGGVYSGTRWGDYVILAPDPAAPDAVWQGNQIANVDGSWFTWVSRIQPAPVGPLGGHFSINGGDEFVDSTFVELEMSNPKDVAVTVIRVANSGETKDGVLVNGQTLPVGDKEPWSLEQGQPRGGPPDGVRTVYVQWGDGRGHWSAVFSDTATLDTTPPTLGAVSAATVGNSTIDASGRVPVEIKWQAGVDALSGLEGYDVLIRMDGGDWQDFASPVRNGATGKVKPGHRYQWQVRSFDRLGNGSEPRLSPVVRVDALDDTSTAIRYDAAWRTATIAGAFRGHVHTASHAASSASFSFTGRSFGLVSTLGPGRGILDVIVDGHPVGRFLEYQTPARSQAVAFRWSTTPGRHTVRLVAADARKVELDGVVLIR